MEPEEKFRELKDRAINELRRKPDCKPWFTLLPGLAQVMCVFDRDYSAIQFSSPETTEISIIIDVADLIYHGVFKLPSKSVFNRYLVRAYKLKTFKDYLQLLEDIMKYPSKEDVVSQTVYTSPSSSLTRLFDKEGSVSFHYRFWLGNDLIDHVILIYNVDKEIRYMTLKNMVEVEKESISLRIAPEAFRAIIKYSMKVVSPDYYLRLEEAIRELVELAKAEKRSIRDVIKELVEVYGYGDVFGYQI